MTLHLSAPPDAEGTPTAPRTGTRLDPLFPIEMAHDAIGVLTTQASARAAKQSTKHERALAIAQAEALNTALRLLDTALANARLIQEASQCP